MTINKLPTLKTLFIRLSSLGVTAYFVGGCVRDEIMKVESDDIDICLVGVSSENLLNVTNLFDRFSTSWVEAGESFPVFILDIDGQKVDVAVARTEQSTGLGHGDFIVNTKGVSIEDDLARRDITINAIAQHCLSGAILDPFGGLADINRKIARPTTEKFKEDPLRVIRAARFIARFDLLPSFRLGRFCNTLSPDNLPKERISMELVKLCKQASDFRPFFDFLDEVGWLEKVFPEIKALQNIEQDPVWHPEGSVYNHTMFCVEQATTPFMRMVMLCHDLGKITTTEVINGKITARGHDIAGVPITLKMLARVFCTVDQKVHKKIACLVEHHMIHANQNISRRMVFKTLRSLHKHGLTFADLRKVCRCDVSGRPPLEGFTPDIGEKHYHEWLTSEVDLLTPIITGNILIETFNVSPGKGIGWVLERALKLQDKGKLTKDNWESCAKNLINGWKSLPENDKKS